MLVKAAQTLGTQFGKFCLKKKNMKFWKQDEEYPLRKSHNAPQQVNTHWQEIPTNIHGERETQSRAPFYTSQQ